MLGFDNISRARNTYNAAYPKGWKGLQSITRTTKEGLKDWFENGDQKKPFADSDVRFRQSKAEKAPEMENAESEQKAKESHGSSKETLKEKIGRWGEEIKESTQHFKYITEKENPVVYNQLRLFESIPDVAKKEAYEKIKSIVKPISDDKNLFDAFERYFVFKDLLYDIEDKELYEGKELPFGLKNAEEVREYVKKLDEYVAKYPVLQKAIANRNSLMYKLRDQMIEAGMLPESARERINYFHHQVLAYRAERGKKNIIDYSKDARLKTKGFQRGRVGSMKDYNTDYLQSEFEVMAQSIESLAVKEMLNKVGKEIDIMPELVQKANDEGGKWKDYIPEGYKRWYPKKGTNAFVAATVAEKAIQNLLEGQDTTLIDEMLAEANQTMWVIPENIARQLDEMKVPQREALPGRAAKAFNNAWKQWTLISPPRIIKYNLNNTSGDLDIVLAYNPAILLPKYGHTAFMELLQANKKGMSQDMKEALQQAVITSGLSIQEIPDINNEGMFKALTGHDNFLMKYWNASKDLTQFRENLLRLAAYKFFKDRLSQGKIEYGASKPESIKALHSIEEKAGKMARELIGDYGNLSQGGQWLRSHVYPFWSWIEINTPRYYNLLKNATYTSDNKGNTAIRTTGIVATKIAMTTAKMMLFMAMVSLWNHMFFRDEEEEIARTETGNRQMKLILGRLEDGTIRTLRISGAFADVLSFVGMEDAIADIKDVREGKSTVGKKIGSAGESLLNKFAGGVMPIEKTLAEVATGKSLYPNILEPRPIRDRLEHALKMAQLDKIYRIAAQKPTNGWKELSGLIFYDVDPGEASYYYMRQRIYDFLDTKEIERPSGEPTEKSNALFYYKQSKKINDTRLANHWLAKYMALGGTKAGIKISISKGEVMSPFGNGPRSTSLSKQNIKAMENLKLKNEFMSTLDAQDKEVLKIAEKWYKETYQK